MKPQTKLNFKHLCMSIGNLPSSYVESLSYYECMLWLCNYLETVVVPTVNGNAEAVEELQGLYIELKSYVDNYLNDEHLQPMINEKLDEMAEDGTLADIVAQYVQLQGLLTYNSVADMKTADNIALGSFLQTYGYYNAGDGGSAKYKARSVTNEDVPDDMFIIALSDPSLVAELMENDINVKQIGATENEDISTYLQKAIDKTKLTHNSVFIPGGDYNIETTIKTYANNALYMNENTYLHLSDINGFLVDGNSIIDGGNIVTCENYSHNVITMLPTSVVKDDEKIGGLFNLSIKNTTAYSTDSVAITFDFTDNDNVESDGITYQSFQNIHISNFDYGIKANTLTGDKWITSLNFDNIKFVFCKNFIYANMSREFTGNKLTNIHLQIDKNNLTYILYLGGKCENNYINLIEWDIDPTLNANTIYLSENTQNNKIEADRLFNYGTLKIISDNGKNNYVTSGFIENTYLQRTNLKYIDLTQLDSTQAYPVLFENMCNIKLWKKSQTGAIYTYLYAEIDAVSPLAGSMMGNYFARISTAPAEKLLPKIEANNSNRYIAVYLRGGFKYEFLDYNYQYQETNSVTYYYSPDYANPYKIVTTTFTSGGITYTPIATDNSIPRGMYYNSNGTINLDKTSTPLTLQ